MFRESDQHNLPPSLTEITPIPEGSETEKSVETREATPTVVDLKSLDVNTQKEITERALEQFRRLLGGTKDYAVFASTAIYLWGKRLKDREAPGAEEFDVPPGDFDAVVFNEKTLYKIQEYLSNLPGVEFDKHPSNDVDEQIKRQFLEFQGDDPTRFLSGSFPMDIQTTDGIKRIKYEFEFFLDTKIVNKRVFQNHDQIAGINVVNLDGLLKQYQNNLEMESRIERSVDEITAFLINPEISRRLETELATGSFSPDIQDAMKKLNLSPAEIQKFKYVQKEITLLDEGTQKFPFSKELANKLDKNIQERAKVLTGGLKTKTAKRRLNVEQVAKLLGRS